LKKFAVAKVFTADNIDVPGSTAQNPMDLTGDNYADDEPMSITQSLPYSGDSTRMGSGLQIDISQELQLNRPAIISIEGIIGVGKSTLMEILSQKYQDNQEVVVLREPSAWNNICVDGVNLLDLSYYNPRRYGFLFQMVYFMAVEQQLQEALKTHRDKRVIICEKSLLSARVVSTEMTPEMDRIKYEVYQTLFLKEGVGDVYPNHIIQLDTEPRNCVGRVSKKNWRGEEIITLEYLQRCRRCHLEMKRRHSGSWTTINNQEEPMETTVERVMKIVEGIKPIEASSLLDTQPMEAKLVSIEGNIGAGKSTLLNDIEQICKIRRVEGIRILKEPVEEWERITDGTKTILELFYENPAEYGFLLQTLVGITTLRRMKRELSDYPDTKLILSERSIISSQRVFAKMLHHDGYMDDVEEEAYQMLFNDEMSTWLTPVMMLYLKTDTNTCLERVGHRNRRGENRITRNQLERCELYHKMMFKEIGTHVKPIDRDLEVDGIMMDWSSIVINWCQQLMDGVKPDQLESPVVKEIDKDDQYIEVHSEIPFEVINMNTTGNSELLPIVNEFRKEIDNDKDEIYLIKFKYGDLICRIALKDSELTLGRLKWEIERPWPILREYNVFLRWHVLTRDNEGLCEDEDLNESLKHIEEIDRQQVDRILLVEITDNNEEMEDISRITTIKKDGERL
jgi:deoxyadenosine/deoxycytidine kinase